jgi:HSP20 family protein
MALSLFNDPFFTSPFAELQRLQNEMNQLFNQSLSASQGSRDVWRPAMDIKERDGNVIIHAELPGVKKENVSIELKEGVLTISGEKKEEKKEEKDKFYRMERMYGKFTRSIALPEGVNESNIKAVFNDGVLEVTFPRLVPKQPETKKITIS